MQQIPEDMREGTRFLTKRAGELVIVKYVNARNVYVRFAHTGYERKTTSMQIRSGDVKDKYFPAVHGKGYIGEGKHSPTTAEGKQSTIYSTWKSMLQRCYDPKFHAIQPTYVGCVVCSEWHNFQVFAEWAITQEWEGKHLDKDIMVQGNTTYSPTTCKFVTQKVNNIQAAAKHYVLISPKGEETSIYNLKEFARDNQLNYDQLLNVHHGKVPHYRQWTAKTISHPQPK